MILNPFKLFKLFKTYYTIKKSGLFDAKYYLIQYPDVRVQDIDPIKHYVKYGAKEGRNPSEEFDTNRYLELYFDVRQAEVNPLYHYIKHGKSEGRLLRSKIYEYIPPQKTKEVEDFLSSTSINKPLFSLLII